MSTIIGADAAKLAGLQIDALTKFRSGQLSLDHWERFLNLSPEAREDRFGDFKKVAVQTASAVEMLVEKFALLADLGIITVPADYEHATRLKSFARQNKKKFYFYNDAITDANFPNPSHVLVPGKKYHVRVFKQNFGGTTTSEERLAFLKSQNALLVGAQGASLVFEEKRDQLPKGYWHSSLDEKDRLWKDAGGDHRGPGVSAGSDGVFRFGLGGFEGVWLDRRTLLCFCDAE